MDIKPVPIPEWLVPAWVWGIAFIGAAVGYLEDFKLEDSWKVWLLKGLTKGSSSALAAVLTYYSLKALGIPEQWHVVLVGIAGHMGVEALKAMGEAWKSRVPK